MDKHGIGTDATHAEHIETIKKREYIGLRQEWKISTERGVLSVAKFCFVFPYELRGPAWAVGSYSISQSAGETSQNITFKTLRQLGRPSLYKDSSFVRVYTEFPIPSCREVFRKSYREFPRLVGRYCS